MAHPVAVVDGLPLSQRIVLEDVLVDVHVIVLLFFKAPAVLAGDEDAVAVDDALALGAGDVVGVLAVAAGDLAAADGGVASVAVVIDAGEVVVDVIALRAGEGNLASAVAHAGEGVFVAKGPADFVHAVDGLLHDAVAAEPGEVIPVPDHPLHVAHAGGAGGGGGHGLDRAGVVGGMVVNDVADGAFEHAGDGGDARRALSPAEAGDDALAIALRLLRSGENLAHAHCVHGHGLLTKDVFAGVDRGFKMDRAKAGRGGEDDEVAAAFEHFVNGVHAGEPAGVRHIDAVFELRAQGVETALDGAGDDVADGPQFDVRVGRHGVAGRATPAPSAADEADLEPAIVRGIGAAGDGGHADDGGTGGGGFQKGTAAGSGELIHGWIGMGVV